MNIAAVVDSLGPSQLSFYLIKEFNKLIKNVNFSPICYYSNISIPMLNTFFGCMNIASFSSFDGAAIATDIETANLLLNTNNSAEKYFYVWDLEWIRRPMPFEDVTSIMSDDSLKLVARSEEHAKLIENYCNKKVCGIVANWNIKDFLNIICMEPAQ